jgi:hypothetical protein
LKQCLNNRGVSISEKSAPLDHWRAAVHCAGDRQITAQRLRPGPFLFGAAGFVSCRMRLIEPPALRFFRAVPLGRFLSPFAAEGFA